MKNNFRLAVNCLVWLVICASPLIFASNAKYKGTLFIAAIIVAAIIAQLNNKPRSHNFF